MTFSLVARCTQTGMFGVAVSSSSPAVAARCAFARARVGAVASQNVTDPRLGPRCLDLMADNLPAPEAINQIVSSERHIDYRQLIAIDRNGVTAIHSGRKALGIWTDAQAPDVASGGNLLANDSVPAAIVAAFRGSSGHLGDRLIGALRAGLQAGGEAGPVHSAGMLLVDSVDWPVASLRCDWTEDCPIEQLAQAWAVYKPQLNDYLQRALDPTQAPRYGVPGDE